ncbi:hypothetical protein B0T20DRAFT_85335 [Sordaria brevicollis]|uniref:Uncharacterized protein n=1 Tax=Sordaria brevicollis TaxID=83679 RepID=A0AAE0U2P3_SORBR|nr:hypothetical protein B0T20DRAFT_85335 [Sordaria brevicollis]
MGTPFLFSLLLRIEIAIPSLSWQALGIARMGNPFHDSWRALGEPSWVEVPGVYTASRDMDISPLISNFLRFDAGAPDIGIQETQKRKSVISLTVYKRQKAVIFVVDVKE